MLKSLHIENYVLIDSLEVDFPEGLIIITGQTGAGKSIILGALSLLMGGKADASVISEEGGSCVVEGVFITKESAVRDILNNNDIEWNGGEIVIRRTVASTGRSRSFVNDSPVPVTVLQELASLLADVHSQHQSLLLTDRRFQLRMLDAYASNTGLLESCAAAWTRLQDIKSELEKVHTQIRKANEEKDYLQARFKQLEEARLIDGELEELEAEQKQLANAGQIKDALSGMNFCFNPEGGSSISSSLKEVERLLGHIRDYVPEAEELSERIDSARIELDDISGTIQTIDSRIELSPERLEKVEERMSLLYDLMKRHSCASIAELIEKRDSLASSIDHSSSLEEQRAELEKELSTAENTYNEIAAAIGASRKKVLKSFAESIEQSLRELELDKALFEVKLSTSNAGPTGCDEIQFLFSSTGSNPVDVAKCASGGEISRIMLCLKAIMAKYSNMPTMFFDEIDTGVSGSVADKMGSMICRMGEYMQVFAITHLPQVAAKGKAHYLVAKSMAGNRVLSTINKIDGEARLYEIARLLSGSTITPEAVANAGTLLK